MKLFFVVACLAIAGLSLPVNAQEISGSGSIKVTPFEVKGLVVGSLHKIDKAFSKTYNIMVPQAFSFIAPRNKQQKVYIEETPGGDVPIKVFFTTQDVRLQSSVQFVPFTVDMAELNARLKGVEGIVKQAFMSADMVNDSDRVNVFQVAKVGKYPALELIGNYQDPKEGLVVRQIVAVLDPDSVNGEIIIVDALTRNVKMTKAEDIRTTSASRAIGTFKFLKE
jgi:hypothetical protein